MVAKKSQKKNTPKTTTITASGKRKIAVARAKLVGGTGVLRFNSVNVNTFTSEQEILRIKEPLILAQDLSKKVNISVNVFGGGRIGQIEAARVAISRALVKFAGDTSSLRETFIEYDRNMLIADVRRKEMRKPNDSKARAKRQKSYR